MPDPVTAIIGGTIGSGVANIFGANKGKDDMAAAVAAANAQAEKMFNKGLDTQKSYFDSSTGTIKSIADKGAGVYDDLVSKLPDLTAPVTMSQSDLEATPGYQFTRDQGIRGVDLSAASKGLSGAQAKAAAMFATDLANTTYKDQWNIANTNKENAFNRLLQTASVGSDAAKTLAGAGTSAGNAALGAATGTGTTQSNNLITKGKSDAAADTSIFGNIGNMLQGGAGLYANGGNINKTFSMYGK
jgi:hypothetical protein